MKILISQTPPHFIDVEAPVLGATEVTVNGRTLWRIWCRHCKRHHWHGPGEGHREAHCSGQTPYSDSGYNLAFRDSPDGH